MTVLDTPQKKDSLSSLYLLPALFIFGVPLLCGCIIITATFVQARHDVSVWRQEFQLALDAQCPDTDVDIVGGAGDVYLEAYQLQYQWTNNAITCNSDGRVVRCSCRTDIEFTNVSKYSDENN